MEIKNFIKIYDDVLDYKTLSNLLRYINTLNFEEGRIVGADDQLVNHNIRKTQVYLLNNLKNSLTEVHWHNLLHFCILNLLRKYQNDNNIIDFDCSKITDISILKYQNEGFYTWHTDHCVQFPRTMSCVLLLNNDYEGGNLCFRNPDGSGEWEVEVKPNRMIIWPSNFLYPHTVKPVTKGTRYSIVSWIL